MSDQTFQIYYIFLQGFLYKIIHLLSITASAVSNIKKAYQRSPIGAKMWNSHNLNSLYDNVVQYCLYVLLEFLVYRELSRLHRN